MRKNTTKTNKFLGLVLSVITAGVLQSCLAPNKPALPDPLAAGWKEQEVCEVVEETDKIRVLKCTFPPGVGHEKHYHEEHFGYTLVGSTFLITDESGQREVNVKTGTSFYNEGVTTHEVLNVGDTIAVFLIIEPKPY